MTNVDKMTRMAEAIEARTGTDYDTAAQYAGEALRRLAEAPAAPWRTAVCPECGRVPGADDHDHLVVGGNVVIGCEGYWVVNPEVLGMARGQWQDWTED